MGECDSAAHAHSASCLLRGGRGAMPRPTLLLVTCALVLAAPVSLADRTVVGSVCRRSCTRKSSAWSTKCRWWKCKGCSQCTRATAPPTKPPTTPPTTEEETINQSSQSMANKAPTKTQRAQPVANKAPTKTDSGSAWDEYSDNLLKSKWRKGQEKGALKNTWQSSTL